MGTLLITWLGCLWDGNNSIWRGIVTEVLPNGDCVVFWDTGKHARCALTVENLQIEVV